MTDEEIAVEVAHAIQAVLGFPPANPAWNPPRQGGAPAAAPPGPSDRVVISARAAVALVRWFLYGDTPYVDPRVIPPDPPPLPEGPEAFAGYTALGVRIYHDPASPSGVVGGDAFTGQAIPEDLFAHVRHYFTAHKISWGIA